MRQLRPCSRRLRRCPALLAAALTSVALLLVVAKHGGVWGDAGQDDQDPDVRQWIRRDERQKEYINRRGIHVIVGHYMGKGLPWESTPNLTDEILNANDFAPEKNAGAEGQAVMVLPHEAARSKLLFHVNKFNLLVSDRIPLNRTLPDARKESVPEGAAGQVRGAPSRAHPRAACREPDGADQGQAAGRCPRPGPGAHIPRRPLRVHARLAGAAP